MPSFSTEVKNELARLVDEQACCRKAELAALLRMGATMSIGARMALGLNFSTENAAIARRTLMLLKSGFNLKTEVMVSRGRRLKKQNIYLIRVQPSKEVGALLSGLGIFQGENLNAGEDAPLFRRGCCRQAYLRGAFLGGGSVNKPESDYHLELVTGNYSFAKTLVSLIKKFDLPVGFTDRKNDYVIYLKDSEAIMDFLSLIGADNALTVFEVARNVKDVRNQVNRLVNCETANLQKTVDAAGRQVDRIRLIENHVGLRQLPANLQEIARLRLAHPEATLRDLAALLDHKLGKSGIQHRLRKLEKIALDLMESGKQHEP